MNSGGQRYSLIVKAILTFALIFLAQAAFLAGLSMLLKDTIISIKDQQHSKEVVSSLTEISDILRSGTVKLLREIDFRKGDEEGLRDSYTAFKKETSHLVFLLKSEPELNSVARRLYSLSDEMIDLAEKSRATYPRNKRDHFLYAMKLKNVADRAMSNVDRIEKHYHELQDRQFASTRDKTSRLLFLVIIAGLLINVGVIIALFQFFIRTVTDRLEVVARNTIKLAARQPLSEPVEGSDEIAELDQAFRKMAQSLEQIQSKQRAILTHAATLICSVDEKGVIVDANFAGETLWGYQLDELRGRRVGSLLSDETADAVMSEFQSLPSKQEVVQIETRVKTKSSQDLALVWTANWSEAEKMTVCVVHDVTERNLTNEKIKASEENFRKIQETLPVGMVIVDQNYSIESVNRFMKILSGYEPGELLGANLELLLAGESSAHVKRKEMIGALNNAREESIEIQLFKKDKGVLPTEMFVSQYQSQKGSRYLVVFKDIGIRFEIERVKKNFVSMISHDIRSPLTAVHGTLVLMADRLSKIELGDNMLDLSQRTVGQLIVLINDFLDLEKIESGRWQYDLSRVTLPTFKMKLEEYLEQTEDGVTCDITISGDSEGFELKVKEDRLIPVIASLAVSTLVFGSEGDIPGIEFRVDQSKCNILINSGNFRAPEDLKQSLDSKYSFVEEMAGTRYSVSGLSLSLARVVVEFHNGELNIQALDDHDLYIVQLPLYK